MGSSTASKKDKKESLQDILSKRKPKDKLKDKPKKDVSLGIRG